METCNLNSQSFKNIIKLNFCFQIFVEDVILYNNADVLASLSQISTQMIIFSNGEEKSVETSRTP